MRLINKFYLHAVLPWFEERSRGLASRMEKFREWELLSSEEVREKQWQKLVELLRHAYESSPFYHHRFESAGFDPRGTFTASEFARIPALTRQDIKFNVADMYSRKYKPEELSISATGGTTDTPVKFYRDAESLRDKNALQWQLDSWAGMHPGDKVFYFWGARSDYAERPSWRWKLYDQYLMRRRWLPTSLMSPEIAHQYLREINSSKPQIVYGYPSPLALFCKYVQEAGQSVHRPKTIICTAELLRDSDRQLIEKTFGCRVFLHYGAREFGMIAGECEQHTGLHFVSPAAYVEFLPLPDAQDEGLAEILVTDLLNFGMPLIRYRVNDCAYISQRQCACGRSYPLVESVVGRTADLFYLPDGTVVPGISLQNRVLQVCPELEKIQVVQNTLHEFTVRYVPGQNQVSDGLAVLQTNLQKFFTDQTVRWTFERVTDIEREPSGKTRFCVSKLSQQKEQDVSSVSA